MAADFDLQVSQRLPLADAILRLFDYATDDEFLAHVYEQSRGRSYTGLISFPLFVHLLSDTLLGHSGSAHQTFLKAKDDGVLNASIQAMYGKLRRVPIPLSQALFAGAAARLAEVGEPAVDALPASLACFRVLALDGKKLKYVVKKLKAIRGLNGNIFGGKLLVAQDIGTRQAVVVEAVADGEASDNPLVPGAVAQVRALRDSRATVWVADRAFCNFETLHRFSEGPDHFVVRYHKSLGFHADPKHPPRTGMDDDRRPFSEDRGWLGGATNPNRIAVRRITVQRRSDEAFILVTSLMAEDAYRANDLLSLYRRRWGIETMFQQVVQTFDLRHLIGGSPEATVIQAVFCLLLYNATLIVRDFVAKGAERTPDTVSLHLLFDEMVRDVTAWMQVIGAEATIDMLAKRPMAGPDELRCYLEERLTGVWVNRWAKAKTRKRPAKTPPRAYIRGGHSSVYKILRGQHEEKPLRSNQEKPETPQAASG